MTALDRLEAWYKDPHATAFAPIIEALRAEKLELVLRDTEIRDLLDAAAQAHGTGDPERGHECTGAARRLLASATDADTLLWHLRYALENVGKPRDGCNLHAHDAGLLDGILRAFREMNGAKVDPLAVHGPIETGVDRIDPACLGAARA